MADSRPVVLVHGAWHGAWCWTALQTELDRRGVASFAIDLPGHGCSIEPLGGLHTDAAHVTKVLDHLGLSDAVLVGHSYGGAVITQAAVDRTDIGHLLYIAAFALDDGESVNGSLRSLERRSVALGAAMRPADDGTTTLDPEQVGAALYGSCPAAAITAALPRLSPQPVATMTESVGGAPRDHITSTYLRCLRDDAVHPDHQEVFASRCTNRVDLDTDHSPFLSAVSETADVIADISNNAR